MRFNLTAKFNIAVVLLSINIDLDLINLIIINITIIDFLISCNN